MKHKIIFAVLFLCASIMSSAWAAAKLQCELSVVKDPAWSAETVTIELMSYPDQQKIAQLVLNAAADNKPSVNSASVTYDCNQYPQMSLQASYTPSIWSTDIGKQYSSKKIYNVTDELLSSANAKVTKLEINANFPADFLGVPPIVN